MRSATLEVWHHRKHFQSVGEKLRVSYKSLTPKPVAGDFLRHLYQKHLLIFLIFMKTTMNTRVICAGSERRMGSWPKQIEVKLMLAKTYI